MHVQLLSNMVKHASYKNSDTKLKKKKNQKLLNKNRRICGIEPSTYKYEYYSRRTQPTNDIITHPETVILLFRANNTNY